MKHKIPWSATEVYETHVGSYLILEKATLRRHTRKSIAGTYHSGLRMSR